MTNSNIGLIYQPCGLGDILFLQKLAFKMKNSGYDLYWPVVSEFAYLNDYLYNFNFVSWQDEGHHLTGPPLPEQVQFPCKELYWPDNPSYKADNFWYFNGFDNHDPIMSGKYNSIGLDWKDWRHYIHFNRNRIKETELFFFKLGLDTGEEYVVVNRNYGIRPNVQAFDGISTDPDHYGCRVIEVSLIPGFTPFDWFKVFAEAKRVDMIETSFNYLLESPALFDIMKNKELNLYSRKGWFGEVDYLFSLPWNYK